jgi:hypothetical protein
MDHVSYLRAPEAADFLFRRFGHARTAATTNFRASCSIAFTLAFEGRNLPE